MDSLVCADEVSRYIVWREHERLELLMEDSLQVLNRNLVASLAAAVLRGVGRNVHLLPAGTVDYTGKELHRSTSRLPAVPSLIEYGIALGPEFLGLRVAREPGHGAGRNVHFDRVGGQSYELRTIDDAGAAVGPGLAFAQSEVIAEIEIVGRAGKTHRVRQEFGIDDLVIGDGTVELADDGQW